MNQQQVTLGEGNTTPLTVVVSRDDPADDLTAVTTIEMLIKDVVCDDDEDATVLSTATGEIVISAQAADEITAVVTVPGSATTPPYPRRYRLDVITPTLRRTAVYGDLLVVDL